MSRVFQLTGGQNDACSLQPTRLATADQYLTLEDSVVTRNMVTDDTGRGSDRCGPGGLPLICGSPDEYLFWDSVHPTTKDHQVLADLVFDQLATQEPLANNDAATVRISVGDVSTPVVVTYRDHDRPSPHQLHGLWNEAGPPRPDSEAVWRTFYWLLLDTGAITIKWWEICHQGSA